MGAPEDHTTMCTNDTTPVELFNQSTGQNGTTSVVLLQQNEFAVCSSGHTSIGTNVHIVRPHLLYYNIRAIRKFFHSNHHDQISQGRSTVASLRETPIQTYIRE